MVGGDVAMDLESVKLGYLKDLYSKEKDVRLKERLHILVLLRRGFVQRDVSDMLEISVGKVPFWKKRFERDGFEGLRDKPKSGKPTKLSKKVLDNLSERLKNLKGKEKEIIVAGWNTKQIRDVIEEYAGVKYSLRHVRRLNSKMGFSLITPRIKHLKRDEKKIKEFKEQFKKNLKKSIKTIR